MLLAGVFTFVVNRAGFLNQLETTFLDAQMRLDVPDEESQVVIVDITQTELRERLQRTDPPAPAGMPSGL